MHYDGVRFVDPTTRRRSCSIVGRRGCLPLVVLFAFFAGIVLPRRPATAEISRRQPVERSEFACQGGIEVPPSVPRGAVTAGSSEQAAAVAERLVADPSTRALEGVSLVVRPVEVAGTTYRAYSSEGTLQMVGRSDSIGMLSFEFVHESQCSSAPVVEVSGSSTGGRVEFLDAPGMPFVYLAEPWAIDRSGRALDTWFEFDGFIVRQVIDATDARAPIIFDPTYTYIQCLGYWSTGNAAFYMNTYSTDPAYCPVYGMLRGAVGYTPVWAFETNVANDYGRLIVRQSGECNYLPDTGPSYDFQTPCKAHDYCYDLRRASFSGTVTDDACDDLFFLVHGSPL